MERIVFLDSGPLGILAHPRPNPDIIAWLHGLLNRGVLVAMPEIADYEVRRELVRSRKTKSIHRLNELKTLVLYIPITTAAMLMAAELWALARVQGKPTAHHHALDGDAILAGQALTFDANGKQLVVATDNVSHLHRFVTAQPWQTIS